MSHTNITQKSTYSTDKLKLVLLLLDTTQSKLFVLVRNFTNFDFVARSAHFHISLKEPVRVE